MQSENKKMEVVVLRLTELAAFILHLQTISKTIQATSARARTDPSRTTISAIKVSHLSESTGS